jgi:hypothetical protein
LGTWLPKGTGDISNQVRLVTAEALPAAMPTVAARIEVVTERLNDVIERVMPVLLI